VQLVSNHRFQSRVETFLAVCSRVFVSVRETSRHYDIYVWAGSLTWTISFLIHNFWLTFSRNTYPGYRQFLLAGNLQRAAALRIGGMGWVPEGSTQQDVAQGSLQDVVPRKLTSSTDGKVFSITHCNPNHLILGLNDYVTGGSCKIRALNFTQWSSSNCRSCLMTLCS
jgi:hypothetical protein